MNSSPFIHLVKTPYGYYVFDVNTNRIYKVKDTVYSALDKIRQGKEAKIDHAAAATIEKMRENGLLKKDRPKRMKHPATDYMEHYLNHKIEGITLQVTQECNFRCTYCPYTQENEMNRRHKKNKMSFETAKKGIDFLQTHSRDAERVSVSFYGGEPLLEFDLIQYAVDYAQKSFAGKPLWLNMTTNCSLLNEEMLDFFEKVDMHITVSLDGPKDIHDNNRRFAANGCGTFDAVMKKLKLIERGYPNFLQKNVSFNVVLDPSKAFDCVNQMFMDYDVLKNSSLVQSGAIDDRFTDHANTYSEEYIKESGYDAFLILASQIGWIDRSKLSPATRQRAAGMENLKKTFDKQSITEEMSHGGPCTVGARKLFMDVQGRFFPCERVSETSPEMLIGSVDAGFDMKQVDRLLNVGRLTETKCRNCWAINHCTICAGMIDDGHALSVAKNFQMCDEVKANIDYQIREHIAVQEIKSGGVL